jgi:NTP pyrophosphatase (non-canonical NTP hydrolase)
MNGQEKVRKFEKKMGWDRTPPGQIGLWLKKDVLLLNKDNAKHKLADVYFETLQLANRNKLDMEKALAKHLKEAEKKYKKRK